MHTFRVRNLYTSASIGIVILERSYNEAESVLRDADISMYQAKRGGRARYAVFDRSTRERMSAQLHMEADLRGAVERGEIVAYYQPIVRVHDRRVSGFEALARWNRPGAGLVAAGEFIAVAEQTGLLRSIDAALFEHVCAATHVFVREHPDITISVNVSAADLTRPSLIDDMEAAMELHDVRPSSPRLEITETAVMEDAARSLAVLHRLRDRGFEIVVDDFGVGQSSLSYLQRLPIGGVKIDASFIAPLGTNAQAIEIVRAIVALTKPLGLSVVAEGVETAEQLRLLQTVGAEYAQGFFFSPAVETPDARSIVAMPEGAVPDKRHAALP
ncbi:MAG TPA: GGDEF domain-containing phosphodiesterase [Candidatus Baltobacteraceae bacterium]|nr:GGDEF domain-containing phosphodiesterase [Candidatus Baltobacteraceae bacterium]